MQTLTGRTRRGMANSYSILQIAYSNRTHRISLEHLPLIDELDDGCLQLVHDVGHLVVYQPRLADEVAVLLQRQRIDEPVTNR